ncbi:protein still life, isoform SIF type 1 [Caerostris darwini]|uniref:Protein still life, isoform SIF type 1 n=1 Tax=Caerostris darwini TaxID=1538125 RepID=A0AAV4QI73_9ARAC|nr:protein still life, isoform SIF type 1 [Caerostris darwini]
MSHFRPEMTQLLTLLSISGRHKRAKKKEKPPPLSRLPVTSSTGSLSRPPRRHTKWPATLHLIHSSIYFSLSLPEKKTGICWRRLFLWTIEGSGAKELLAKKDKGYSILESIPNCFFCMRSKSWLWLWAEVFHVSSSAGAAARWQQVSEDLVPVNITCVQDSPECVFHITAYNSQVEKILDVRLVQPGTRLGQASECFVYWKDPTSGDTWGLNFTSPVDAKQFRDCCQLKLKAGKRVPQSTPSSPSKAGGREPRCTCAMTIEQMQRAKNGRARYAAAGSLPTTLSRDYGRLSNHPSSQSVYDNVSTSLRRSTPIPNAVKQTRSDVNLSTIGQRETTTFSRTELARAKFAQASIGGAEDAKSVDYGMGMGAILRKASSQDIREGSIKSKSTDNVNTAATPSETTAKKPLTASASAEDKLKPPKPPPKPEPPPKRGKSSRGQAPSGGTKATSSSKEHGASTSSKGAKSTSSSAKPSKSGAKKKGVKKLEVPPERERSPPSDHLLYDNLCYATTPSTSNDNSDAPFLSSEEDEQEEEVKQIAKEKKIVGPRRGAANSPTSKLLMEYEMHLRNALARGLDAESYSLQTFEALLTQSMENVVALMREVHVELEEVRKEEQALQSYDEPEGSRAFANARSTTSGPKSSTLPLPGSTRQPPHLAARGDNSTPLLPRASVESTDSRIYLTSSEGHLKLSLWPTSVIHPVFLTSKALFFDIFVKTTKISTDYTEISINIYIADYSIINAPFPDTELPQSGARNASIEITSFFTIASCWGGGGKEKRGESHSCPEKCVLFWVSRQRRRSGGGGGNRKGGDERTSDLFDVSCAGCVAVGFFLIDVLSCLHYSRNGASSSPR